MQTNTKQEIRLRNDVFRAANYMMKEQGTQISGMPGVKMSLTAYVNELIINDLSKRGHYPPRDEEP
jgi:hypothetical protein